MVRCTTSRTRPQTSTCHANPPPMYSVTPSSMIYVCQSVLGGWAVRVNDHAGVEDGGVGQCQRSGTVRPEQSLTLCLEHGADPDPVLVEQAGLAECVGEAAVPPDEDVATLLFLELGELSDQFRPGHDDSGAPLAGVDGLGGDHVLGDGVDVVGVRVATHCRPCSCHALVG